jgi:iron complex transport system ATP-binding protein
VIEFPDLTCTRTDKVLLLHCARPLTVLSSAVVGGGFTQARTLLIRHVPKGYDHPDPVRDLRAFARHHGIEEPFVGLMTAAYLHRARAATQRDGELTVAAVVTAGLSNPAAPGLSPPAVPTTGTINTILLVDARLTPAAMVNAVITATEAKAHVLLAQGARTLEGHPATGTSTDAIVVACTGRGTPLPYAGPVTRVGWLIGRCLRRALEEALHAAGK